VPVYNADIEGEQTTRRPHASPRHLFMLPVYVLSRLREFLRSQTFSN